MFWRPRFGVVCLRHCIDDDDEMGGTGLYITRTFTIARHRLENGGLAAFNTNSRNLEPFSLLNSNTSNLFKASLTLEHLLVSAQYSRLKLKLP